MNKQCYNNKMVNESPITSEDAKRWLNTVEFNHYNALINLENMSEKDNEALNILVHKVHNRKNHGPLCSHRCCW